MPGSILDGELMVLCPVASAPAVELLQARASHQHHHAGADNDDPSVSSACPIGSSLFFDVVPEVDAQLALARLPLFITRLSRAIGHVESVSHPHAARGPPQP